MIIADTDVLIDFLAGVSSAADYIATELQRGSLQTTAITRFELLSGARNPRQEAVIRQLLAAIPTLALDEAASDRAAEVRRSLERAGNSIGMADSLIAGIALLHGAVLLTHNRRHFERVPSLRLANFST